MTFFLLSYSRHGIGFGPYRIDLDVYRIGGRAWLDGRPLYGRLAARGMRRALAAGEERWALCLNALAARRRAAGTSCSPSSSWLVGRDPLRPLRPGRELPRSSGRNLRDSAIVG